MMKRETSRWLVAGVVAAALAGCGKEGADDSQKAPPATPMTVPAALAAATRAQTTSKPKETFAEISKDEAVPFETPEGKGFKIRKNGLAFRDEKVGEGNAPELGNKLEVKFNLMHMDKKEIESNLKDPKSAPFRFTFGTKDEKPFWNEAVVGMKRGGKRVLIVPPALAFGEKGFKDATGKERVAPNETLLAEIELVNVFGDAPPEPTDVPTGPQKYSTTAPADLKIEDLKEGTGAGAAAGQKLSVKYVGMLTNGEVFDQGTYQVMLGYGDVIQGWHMGLAGMKVGGKRKLTIPSRLAYGERGSPPKIPANATLVFEVELLEIK